MSDLKSKPGVALCSWLEFDYEAGRFEPDGEPPTECRASIGAKVVTIWLPRGAVIRCQRDRVHPERLQFRRYFGREFERKRIDIVVEPRS